MKALRVLLVCVLGLALGACAQASAASLYEIEPPIPKGYDMPYTITVYIGSQMVVVYDANTGKPARTMICSTGKGNGTPRGTFIMPSTYENSWANWGHCYVRYPTTISRPYYFHSILYSISDKSLDRRAWNNLGTKASAGCVRMTPLDAQWINYNCKRGTRIRIVTATDDAANPIGLTALRKQIRAQLDRNGPGSVQPTLKPTPTPPPPTIDANSTRTLYIKSLQKRLRGHGFYGGALTGKFDAATIDAWNAYQKTQGWPQDSVATPKEQAQLADDEDTIAFMCDLSSGSTGVIVRKVEEQLKSLRFFSAKPDNTYDVTTAVAVKKYQLAAGLVPANGKLLAAQQPLLFSAAAPTPTPYPALQSGSAGSRVKSLQTRLFSLGFYAGAVTGRYQLSTVNAVSDYQTAAGLAVTGTADAALQSMIQNDNTYVGTARKLIVNSKGIVVTRVEEQLKALGLFGGSPNHIYDQQTAIAVKKYQKQKGLAITGVANTALLQALFAEVV